MTREIVTEAMPVVAPPAAEMVGGLAMGALVEAAAQVPLPPTSRRLGRLAVTERYEPIRQPDTPTDEQATAATKREPRAVSRFGGQTLLDSISGRIKSARRPGHPAVRGRSS